MSYAIDDDIHRREATLRILCCLSSSGTMRAECIGDSIEIRRLCENICRELILKRRGRQTLWNIEGDMIWAKLEINSEYKEKIVAIAYEKVLFYLWCPPQFTLVT